MRAYFFFFNDTATTEIYTLSLHDALPICGRRDDLDREGRGARAHEQRLPRLDLARAAPQEPVQMAEEARPGLLRKEHAERLAAQQLAAVVEQQLRPPVHLLDDSQGVGHDVPTRCELEELLVAPALVFQRQLRGQELLVLLAQLLLGEAQGLDRARLLGGR